MKALGIRKYAQNPLHNGKTTKDTYTSNNKYKKHVIK